MRGPRSLPWRGQAAASSPDGAAAPGRPRSPAHRTSTESDLERHCGGRGREPRVGRGAEEGASQRDRACGVGGPPGCQSLRGDGDSVQLSKGDPARVPSGPAAVPGPAPGDRTLGGFGPAPANRWHSVLWRPGSRASLRRASQQELRAGGRSGVCWAPSSSDPSHSRSRQRQVLASLSAPRDGHYRLCGNPVGSGCGLGCGSVPRFRFELLVCPRLFRGGLRLSAPARVPSARLVCACVRASARLVCVCVRTCACMCVLMFVRVCACGCVCM